MRNYLLLFLFYFHFIPFSEAHLGSLKGIIKDDHTGMPVMAAQVSLNNTHFETFTDTSGVFGFQNIPASSYILTVTAEKHRLKAVKVEVSSDLVSIIDITVQPDFLNLPLVFVSADKPQSAASSQAISKIDMELRPKNSAQDLLRMVPGLFIAQHAGGGKAEQIFLRGFDCDHGTDVAVYADDMPVNMPSHGHGQGYADAHFIIPETVEEMEVNKGPYFISNGDFATAGAVRFKTADDLQNNKVIEEIASTPGHRTISSNRNVFLLKIPTGSEVTSSYIGSEIFYNPGYFEHSQDMIRFNLFGKIKTQLNESSTLSFEAGGFGSSWNASGQIPERAVNNGIISRYGSIDSSEGGNTGRTYFNADYHQRKNKQELDIQAYQSTTNFKLYSDFTFYLNDPVHGDEIEQTDHRSIAGINAWYSVFNDKHAVKFKTIVGGGLRNDNITNSLWHDEDRNRLNVVKQDDIHETATDIYAGEEVTWTEKLKTNFGLRFDYLMFDVNDLLRHDSLTPNLSGFNYQSLPSPKLNIIYSFTDRTQFFVNSGIGFHSNDARTVVTDKNNHQLPLALGGELGMSTRLKQFIMNVAFWNLDLENELVYSGDDGTTEVKGPSRRTGIDVSIRCNLNDFIYADVDVNISRSRFLDKKFGNELNEEAFVPLAPAFTSTGGITYRQPKGFQSSVRYRYMGDRPADESGSVIAKHYAVFDWISKYRIHAFEYGLTVENVLNTDWDEAQFDTNSRLFNEANAVSEIHFTPGIPRTFKLQIAYLF